MITEANKAVYRMFIDEVVNRKKLDRIPECIGAEMIEHTPGLRAGAAGLRQDFEDFYFAAFPDLQLTIEELIAEGDLVAARYTWTGTHQGAFMGIPASGKRVQCTGLVGGGCAMACVSSTGARTTILACCSNLVPLPRLCSWCAFRVGEWGWAREAYPLNHPRTPFLEMH